LYLKEDFAGNTLMLYLHDTNEATGLFKQKLPNKIRKKEIM
jgi:hypothetical protein